MKHRRLHRPPAQMVARQRGVVLLFSLIALVIMLIAAVALVRSFNSSLFTAGNIAFKRDLQNQSERAADVVLSAFRPLGTLNTTAQRAVNVPTSNYSATMFAANAQGIPNALVLPDATFAATYKAPDLKSDDGSVTIRYVVDRLCATVGDETTLGPGSCMLADNKTPAGTSASNQQSAERASGCATCPPPAVLQGVIYRLSIKATGPRNTQSFFQSTFTVPSL